MFEVDEQVQLHVKGLNNYIQINVDKDYTS